MWIKYLLVWAAIAALVSGDSLFLAASASAEDPAENGQHDFDFMVGRWHAHNRRLKERAVGSEEWIEFDTVDEFPEPFMQGMANMDRSYWEVDGKQIEGITLRVFDPARNEWTIYWMANVYPQLTEQVRGRWRGNRGEFYGEEEYQGRLYRMRFLWTKVSNDEVYWEQAYYLSEAHEWETNWTMSMTRIQP